jgi:hypothetical protein
MDALQSELDKVRKDAERYAKIKNKYSPFKR